ncbi:hypothetical protein C8R43DRAFT_947171 [Mycena crocata]|nr:hypothetical protein C8R43DRAFT_947171 [Mycena crocata]
MKEGPSLSTRQPDTRRGILARFRQCTESCNAPTAAIPPPPLPKLYNSCPSKTTIQTFLDDRLLRELGAVAQLTCEAVLESAALYWYRYHDWQVDHPHTALIFRLRHPAFPVTSIALVLDRIALPKSVMAADMLSIGMGCSDACLLRLRIIEAKGRPTPVRRLTFLKSDRPTALPPSLGGVVYAALERIFGGESKEARRWGWRCKRVRTSLDLTSSAEMEVALTTVIGAFIAAKEVLQHELESIDARLALEEAARPTAKMAALKAQYARLPVAQRDELATRYPRFPWVECFQTLPGGGEGIQ